jgi:hypothetical protein
MPDEIVKSLIFTMKNMKEQKIDNNFNFMLFMSLVFYNIAFFATFYEFISAW